MPETTPLIKAALNLRGGAGFDVYELSKGNMVFDIVALINSGVITVDDLGDFSDGLKDSVDFLLHR